MANEPEVIRQQMEETRASLADKLETLEQQVMETVQGTTNAVTDTVENVKETVQETIQSVREAFDLRRQVDQHPWLMLCGSVAVGYLAGSLLVGRIGSNRSRSAGPTATAEARDYRHTEEPPRRRTAPTVRSRRAEHGWLSGMGDLFGTEINKLKGLAVGTTMGLVRDLLTRGLPEQVGSQVAGVVDGITTKLGGEPVHGPVLQESSPTTDTVPNGGSLPRREPSRGHESMAAAHRTGQAPVASGYGP
jgi:hypothetical protein